MFLLPKNDWKYFFESKENLFILKGIYNKYQQECKVSVVFPEFKNIFKAFEYTEYKSLKVVIIGQDPYHGHGQANGLCFSVNNTTSPPPSLKNIFKELKNEYKENFNEQRNPNLEDWSKQGVLLLNMTLTVRENIPNSHLCLDWGKFTLNVIKYINENSKNIVFVLLGKESQKISKYINNENHKILITSHPSPLSSYRGFFGSDIFKKINNYLQINNRDVIKW